MQDSFEEIDDNDDIVIMTVDREHAIGSYRDIWEDFYNWEFQYCQQSIVHLASLTCMRCPDLQSNNMKIALDLTQAHRLSLDDDCEIL